MLHVASISVYLARYIDDYWGGGEFLAPPGFEFLDPPLIRGSNLIKIISSILMLTVSCKHEYKHETVSIEDMILIRLRDPELIGYVNTYNIWSTR